MANIVGEVFKNSLLIGEQFGAGVPVDLSGPDGSSFIRCGLWSSAASATTLRQGTNISTTYTTGSLKQTNMSGFAVSNYAIWDAADVTHTAVTGSDCTYVTPTYCSGGPGAVAIVVIDTATGLPFTPTGGDVTVVWDNGTNKIMKL
jgi:hypothetical protein